MNWNKAKKKQLLQIVLHEDCSLDMKYAAVRELQRRGKSYCPDTTESYSAYEESKIIQLYLDGYQLSNIALRFGRSKQGIKDKLRALHKRGLPYRTKMRWAKNGKSTERRARVW